MDRSRNPSSPGAHVRAVRTEKVLDRTEQFQLIGFVPT
jgi:hypothetical protein